MRSAFLAPLLAAASLVAAAATPPPPAADLPPGLELIVAAAPPLVKHPTMGAFDDRGRLFIGDSAGVNWRPPQLEKELPHRVLMLEDTDRDGVFDKSTVFADKMTFPQGACWLDGSLYVASPPGIWKFTDTDNDGVADRREMIVSGFEYDGNAADVHGPFLHPTNGRLYWCHGRKGHKVTQRDGTLVHEGKASGIWSCRPDGSDVQWHSLGCMDNPVEVDFTPDGEILGVVNIYYNQPRGDTLMHWLRGGAYERPDLLNVIADLPRTRDHMPVVHNYGHVAVSGFTLYRSGALDPSWKGDAFVTFFNTQKLVRTKLIPSGSTYTATTHEFLKIHNPDVHLTDVIEDADGSLLLLDTGGWFRIGCPASLVEKPDLRGALYRVRKKASGSPAAAPAALARATTPAPQPPILAALRDASNPRARLRACETLSETRRIEPAQREALLALLAEPLDPALEHAAMFAALSTRCFDLETLRQATAPRVVRRLLRIIEQTATGETAQRAVLDLARHHVSSPDADLASAAAAVVARHPRALEASFDEFTAQLAAPRVAPASLAILSEVVGTRLAQPQARALVATMLAHADLPVRQAAWRILARQTASLEHPAWHAPLSQTLATAAPGDLPLLLDALSRLKTTHFDPALLALVADTARPAPIRLKALAASLRPGQPLGADAFSLLLALSQSDDSPAARMDAARFLSGARLSDDQYRALAPVLATTGPVELAELLKLVRRKTDPALGRLWAENLARSPVFGAIEESAIRSAFSSFPAELYETVLMPAVRAAAAAEDAKKRRLETLTAAASRGRPAEGRAVYAASACVACHKAADLGRTLGPDLSTIGGIRNARDLFESILFPGATIARDFDAHIVETSDRRRLLGTLRSDTAEGLVLVDPAGEEIRVPRAQVVAHSVSPVSLMPPGLEQTLTEQQLLDLVAWLLTLR